MRYILFCLILSISLYNTAQAQTYTVGTPGISSLYDIRTTGTVLNLGDDQTALVNLGFSFNFYGNDYTSAFVSSNGFLSFTDNNQGCCDGYALPGPINNSIFVGWTDLIRITTGSNQFYQTIGDPGSYKFVVGYYNNSEFYDQATQNSLEMILHQTSNDIEFQYGGMDIRNHYLTAGIQGPAGTQSVQLYYGIGQSGISNALSNKSFCFSTTSGSSCGISPIPPVIVDQEPIDTTDLGPVIGVDNIAGLDFDFPTDDNFTDTSNTDMSDTINDIDSSYQVDELSDFNNIDVQTSFDIIDDQSGVDLTDDRSEVDLVDDQSEIYNEIIDSLDIATDNEIATYQETADYTQLDILSSPIIEQYAAIGSGDAISNSLNSELSDIQINLTTEVISSLSLPIGETSLSSLAAPLPTLTENATQSSLAIPQFNGPIIGPFIPGMISSGPYQASSIQTSSFSSGPSSGSSSGSFSGSSSVSSSGSSSSFNGSTQSYGNKSDPSQLSDSSSLSMSTVSESVSSLSQSDSLISGIESSLGLVATEQTSTLLAESSSSNIISLVSTGANIVDLTGASVVQDITSISNLNTNSIEPQNKDNNKQKDDDNNKSSNAISNIEKKSKENSSDNIQKEASTRLTEMQEGDYFDSNQGIVVAFIGYSPTFKQYYGFNIADASTWYITNQIYKQNKIGYKTDNRMSIASDKLIEQMILDQYRRIN